MSHRPNFQGGRRGSGGRSGGRGGGGGGGRGVGRGGGGEQRWWDPAWRAERLRQKAAEESDNVKAMLSFREKLLAFKMKSEFLKAVAAEQVDASANILKISEQSCPVGELNGIKVKALEVTTKVLEAIAYGTVVLAPLERLHMVKIWLPYIRLMKPLTDSFSSDEDNNLLVKFDCELWQSHHWCL